MWRIWIRSFFVAALCLLLTSCYQQGQLTPDAWDLTEQQIDSISFSTTHHYSQNYNFVVNADTLRIVEEGDTALLHRGDHIVVADIEIVPQDTIDSVLVNVARDQLTQGWVHENEMLLAVSPDDSISQFIDFFSDTHLLVFMAFIVLVIAAYGLYRLSRRHAYIVHFHDIDTFFPMLLCLLVASSATLYASIQLFGSETWRHFYYHPSLNPFALPLHLGVFVSSVWAILIVGMAAVDDTLRRLPLGDALLYLGGLAAVCAVDYVVFSITTLWYVGYPLLVVYVLWAVRRYSRFSLRRYVCGQCGRQLQYKGKCPYCGAQNE